jgi:NADH-quinone oxidoreductase subunit E
MNVQRVDEIIDSYQADRTCTLSILQDVQAEYNYLPREAIIQTANRLGVTLGEVYRMATFFRAFSLEPKGEYTIRVCMGTACHVRGAVQILEQFERDLGIKAGETSRNRRFSLEVVMCLGACALGPVVMVNEETHGEMSPDKAHRLSAQLKNGSFGQGAERSAA